MRDLLLLKLRLLMSGLKLGHSVASHLDQIKPRLRTRSGVSGGLDLVLTEGIHVNCTTSESFAQSSPFTLEYGNGIFEVVEADRRHKVAVYPRPAYYDLLTSGGTQMSEVGQMCSGDRICIGMTRHCVFWKREDRCTYCSIGANIGREAPSKTVEMIVETVSAAVNDRVLPAHHVLIGGGTPNLEDRGARFAADICAAIKRHTRVSAYVMIVPPRDLEDIHRLRDAGVDELGMNLEFFTERAMREHAPGKLRHVGIDHHYRSLEEAVRLFGPGNARSIVIVGLEPQEATIQGAIRLARMGVMPILSPFRPLDGSDLQRARGFSPEILADIYQEVAEHCAGYGLPPGPACIPCQNNTLAMPQQPGSRYYGRPWAGAVGISRQEQVYDP